MPRRCRTRPSRSSSSRLIVAAAIAVACSLAVGCSNPARSFGRTASDARINADGLFTGLGRRFGPLERDQALRSLRPRLLKNFLTPGAIHRDSAMWSAIDDSVRVLAVAGGLVENRYLLAKATHVPRPGYPGASRHVMRLRQLDEDVFEWDATDELAVGEVRAQELYDVLTRALHALEAGESSTLRAAMPRLMPRASAALGRLFSLDSLESTPLGDGSSVVAVEVRLEPDRIRAASPKLAEYLRNYISSSRYDITIEDESSVPWLRVRADRERWSARWRTRDGRLQPLEGDLRPAPATFRIRVSASMKVFLFRVGLSELEGELRVIDTERARGWEMRFRDEPAWHLPLASEHLLGAPLRRPFEGEGALLRYAARDLPGEQTVLARDMRIRVQESAALRLLNRIGNKVATDFENGAEAELMRFTSEALEALHRDMAAQLPGSARIRAISGGF